MKPNSTSSHQPVLAIIVAALVMPCAAFVAEASAACSSTPSAASAVVKPLANLPSLPFAAGSAVNAQARTAAKDADFVGLWFATFRLDDGTIWNKGFQLIHADKTELSVDNAVPPALGNVCIGVWEHAGGRTIKIRHVTWNWNPDGSPAGTFLLISTLRLDAQGDSYTGTFSSDSFDLSNQVIPALHAEGTIRGSRITVD